MKPRVWIMLLVVAMLAGCQIERRAEVRGRIVGFGDDARTIIVEHEAIPDVMPAMTMPFELRTPGGLDTLDVGDAIGFSLVIRRNDSWIEDVRRLPDTSIARHPAASPDAFHASAEPPFLEPGEPIPALALRDQDGELLRLDALPGRATLLTFVYTRCPLPDFCPRLSAHFQRLQPQLQARYGDAVQLLSVSFDPAYDTPEVLRQYAARYGADLATWRFATGDPALIDSLTAAFGVYYMGEDEQINHNLATALIDEEGRLYRLWRGTDWDPDAVLRAVERLLES